MANNIFQQRIKPVTPKVLEKERIFVYVPKATTKSAGIAYYNPDDFTVSNLAQVSVIWPYAHDNKFGLVKIAEDSNSYLKFTNDENHYLQLDIDKLDIHNSNLIDTKISNHNSDASAHSDIRQNITTSISNHNSDASAHSDIRQNITTSISNHNFDASAHNDIRQLITNQVKKVNSIQIRNIEPDLIIEATGSDVQVVATQYIRDNYDREPIANDGLFITRTDLNDDIIKYAYFNDIWINVGQNAIDLSNYVDLTTNQIISGDKNFVGNITKNGSDLATLNDIESAIGGVSAILGNTEDLEV